MPARLPHWSRAHPPTARPSSLQFVEKDPRLADAVIRALLKFWPLTNSHKEVLFLGELEEVLELTQVCGRRGWGGGGCEGWGVGVVWCGGGGGACQGWRLRPVPTRHAPLPAARLGGVGPAGGSLHRPRPVRFSACCQHCAAA